MASRTWRATAQPFTLCRRVRSSWTIASKFTWCTCSAKDQVAASKSLHGITSGPQDTRIGAPRQRGAVARQVAVIADAAEARMAAQVKLLHALQEQTAGLAMQSQRHHAAVAESSAYWQGLAKCATSRTPRGNHHRDRGRRILRCGVLSRDPLHLVLPTVAAGRAFLPVCIIISQATTTLFVGASCPHASRQVDRDVPIRRKGPLLLSVTPRWVP
jgi:hypothetical protein